MYLYADVLPDFNLLVFLKWIYESGIFMLEMCHSNIVVRVNVLII